MPSKVASVAARSPTDDMTLAKLKNSVTLNRFKSKYRHKSKFPHSNGGSALAGLPTWAKVLIIIAIVIVALFVFGLIYHFYLERKRSKETGKSIRWKTILWRATRLALFLWIPIYIYRAVKNRSWKGQRGSYAEINEDQQRLNNTTSETKHWDQNLAANIDTKYEPMGHKSTVYDPYSAYAGVADQPVRASVTGAASPAPFRSASPPTTSGMHMPPPPHESGDLGSRTPSPPRGSFPSPSQPPPTYTG